MFRLFTIGYEGASIEDFVGTIHTVGATTLADVRALPLSRRRGFSKKALAESVDVAGIKYIHLRGLGDPKAGREAARSGRIQEFRKIFAAHMESDEAIADLALLIELMSKSDVCLMCYERDPSYCHRSIVADAASNIVPARIEHLGVKEGIASERVRYNEWAGANSRQSAAAS